MTDSISVIGPGWRATDENGELIADAILEFYLASTTTPLDVFSDSALSANIGPIVNCNAAGYPVTSGNEKTLIYTGTASYKIKLTSTAYGGTVWEHDDVKGAVDTSSFITSAIVPDRSVVHTSTNRSITTADKGKLINVDCSASPLTITLDDATTLGDGFWISIRHDGTANSITIIGDGVDTFGTLAGSVTSFTLKKRGHAASIICNGAGFKVDGLIDDSVPIGHPSYWLTATPPTGWLELNGASLSVATYPDLFAVLRYTYGGSGANFSLPDDRGRFIRGWAHGSVNDPDRASRTNRGDGTTGDNVGTGQADDFKSHTHTQQTKSLNSTSVSLDTNSTWWGTSLTATGATGGNETRPINRCYMPIIRAY